MNNTADNTRTSNTISDLFDAGNPVAREQIKTRTVRKSEKDLIIQQIKNEVNVIKVNRDNLLKTANGDKMLTHQINSEAKTRILALQIKFQPAIKNASIDVEAVGEALFSMGGEKVGAFVATPVKAAKGFFGSLMRRAGIIK